MLMKKKKQHSPLSWRQLSLIGCGCGGGGSGGGCEGGHRRCGRECAFAAAPIAAHLADCRARRRRPPPPPRSFEVMRFESRRARVSANGTPSAKQRHQHQTASRRAGAAAHDLKYARKFALQKRIVGFSLCLRVSLLFDIDRVFVAKRIFGANSGDSFSRCFRCKNERRPFACSAVVCESAASANFAATTAKLCLRAPQKLSQTPIRTFLLENRVLDQKSA